MERRLLACIVGSEPAKAGGPLCSPRRTLTSESLCLRGFLSCYAQDMKEVVFVVDDDAAVRRSLSRLIRSAGYDVETFADPGEFLKHPPSSANSCLVLDVRMPGITGLQLQGPLASSKTSLQIVFITGHADVPSSVEAMKKGAVDFLMKPFHGKDLLQAIDNALEKNRTTTKKRAELEELETRLMSLTDREHDVYDLVVTGKLNKQIADELGISEKTVKVHRGRVMQKMKADSLAELVQIAGKLKDSSH